MSSELCFSHFFLLIGTLCSNTLSRYRVLEHRAVSMCVFLEQNQPLNFILRSSFEKVVLEIILINLVDAGDFCNSK